MKNGCAIPYSKQELEFLKSRCELPRKELHGLFCLRFKRNNVNVMHIKSLCKRKGWLTGRSGCFEKGHVPDPKSYPTKPNRTSFKKGHKPHNWLPVYSTRISKDGYLEMKVSEPTCWRALHVLLWEKQHGPKPKGFVLNFIDGEKSNISMNNLELVTQAQHLAINQLRFGTLPDEIKPVARTLGKLMCLTGVRP